MVACIGIIYASIALTNIQQLAGVELSDEVVRQFPVADYTTPHQTLLSFERAMHFGDFTNSYYCCTDSCNKEDLGVDSLAEVPVETIKGCLEDAKSGTNMVSRCIGVSILQSTSNSFAVLNRYSYTIPAESNRPERVRTERVHYELQLTNGLWKISRWDPWNF